MAKTPKRPRDINQLAHLLGGIATGEVQEEKEPPDTRNPAAVALSALGASKGGFARAASQTKKQRVASAKKAAKARWGKKSNQS